MKLASAAPSRFVQTLTPQVQNRITSFRWARHVASALTVVVAVLIGIVCAPAVCAWQEIGELHDETRTISLVSRSGAVFAAWDPWVEELRLDDIPLHVEDAIVSIEDHRFYRHFGIDPIAIARAAVRNLREGRVVQGGSTITQQLARLRFLTPHRHLLRKAQEAVLALALEMRLTKQQILTAYLNTAFFCPDRPGLAHASHHLFGKSPRALSLGEAALLAGLLQAPSRLAPRRNTKGALERRHIVLARMQASGFISERQARTARAWLTDNPSPPQPDGGWATKTVQQEVRRVFNGDPPKGTTIVTTFDPRAQRIAERVVRDGLRILNVAGLQAALVAIDPASGGIRAVVGGRDRTSGFNRAVQARRQPGSAFKPVVFAAALNRGWTPESELVDEQERIITLRTALTTSNNLAAMDLIDRVGVGNVAAFAGNLGFGSLSKVPSLALGTGEVSLVELTAAYAAFANGGLAIIPHSVERMQSDECELYRHNHEPRRILSRREAFQMRSMLEDVVERGTASAAQTLGFRVGGKTGTSAHAQDAWFVGFSSALVVGVWVGFDQPKPIGKAASGASVALPIWIDFMRETAKLFPPRDFGGPGGV